MLLVAYVNAFCCLRKSYWSLQQLGCWWGYFALELPAGRRRIPCRPGRSGLLSRTHLLVWLGLQMHLLLSADDAWNHRSPLAEETLLKTAALHLHGMAMTSQGRCEQTKFPGDNELQSSVRTGPCLRVA